MNQTIIRPSDRSHPRAASVVALACTLNLAITGSPFARAEYPATRTGHDGALMVLVPAGGFIMGSSEGTADETPPHERAVNAYYIDATEVTNAQYQRYLQATGAAPPPDWADPSKPSGRPDWPVANVTWYDAMRYAIWAGKRLPTEAEWEKAARGTDGRRFPWGQNAEKGIARLEGAKFRPVGSHPRSASPFGCQDMAGNAWEWTADWYDAYPGTNARLIHFGRKYKVMRGGGTEYFYTLNENSGRCSLRGRILPYAGEDYLGFRCAQDANPDKPAYDPRRLLAEAEDQLRTALPAPRPLSYEAKYAAYLEARTFPIRIAGAAGRHGLVRAGVPFPEAALEDITRIQVIGPDGLPRPTQRKLLTPWRDGSARWVLLDFPAMAGESCAVSFEPSAGAGPPAGIRVTTTPDEITFDTGEAVLVLSRGAFIARLEVNGRPVAHDGRIELVLDSGRLRPLPAEHLAVESDGPLRATARITGWFADESGKQAPIQYDARIRAHARSARVHLLLTLSHLQPRTGDIAARTPVARIADASVRFTLPEPAARAVFAADRGVVETPLNTACELIQPDALRYTLTRDGHSVAEGTRCPGWLAGETPGGWLSLGLRHFWQNHAKALAVTPREAAIRLWAGHEPVEFEATIAKTHELILDVSPRPPTADDHIEVEPLRISIDPAWACGTRALGGPMIPRCDETIERLPYWELAREGGMQRWMRAMCYGWRDFGDTRHGGETKGANAFHNLEYDVPFNFLLQYLTTGHSWYLDAAEIQCRHQADIDTDQVTGQPYKHERFHTSWRADIAHMFLRGLVAHYWLTGEERSLETARRIGDHIAPQAEKNQNFGNERQIGWGLYALTGVYEATLDPRYLNAASNLCANLLAGMSPHGKFNIRWDNRMSLMNGMAMNGMMSVQELTGDEQLADGILRLARRTLGFYPEYALRTLHGYAWAMDRTNDPRYLDVLDKTWQSCLELTVRSSDATDAEVHAWRFPWFAGKYGLFPLFETPPAALPEAGSWRGQWLPLNQVEAYIRSTGGEAAVVMVLLDGLAEGRAELFDFAGTRVRTVELTRTDRLYQPAVFSIPGGGGTHRLRLTGYHANGWEIHHDEGSIVTFHDPKAELINVLCPKAYGILRPAVLEPQGDRQAAGGVRILFEAMGEGEHFISLYDADGNIRGTAAKYVPLEDKGRYEVELVVPIRDARPEVWALEAHQARVLRIEGFEPYWSSRREGLFNPESAGRP